MKRESWLPATPPSAAIARAIVREFAAWRGLRSEETWDLMLATTEAVANAIKHGTPCGRNGFLLTVESCDYGLCVEVSDCGGVTPAVRPPNEDALDGRGIPLIAAVTDLFEIRQHRELTRVRFGKRSAVA